VAPLTNESFVPTGASLLMPSTMASQPLEYSTCKNTLACLLHRHHARALGTSAYLADFNLGLKLPQCGKLVGAHGTLLEYAHLYVPVGLRCVRCLLIFVSGRSRARGSSGFFVHAKPSRVGLGLAAVRTCCCNAIQRSTRATHTPTLAETLLRSVQCLGMEHIHHRCTCNAV
jgi:hypothetical protein